MDARTDAVTPPAAQASAEAGGQGVVVTESAAWSCEPKSGLSELQPHNLDRARTGVYKQISSRDPHVESA